MTAYYNEWDKPAAAWLRELIKQGLIANGVVDDRSITDVSASDLKGFTQIHLFAGIGGFSKALRMAGWSDDRPVFSASLPCQSFSVAGKQKGKDDERHLLPHVIELVRQLKPSVCLGEQVENAIVHGWLDDLYAEFGGIGYDVSSQIIPAAAVGAPHIRSRLWWIAKLGEKSCLQQKMNEAIKKRFSATSSPIYTFKMTSKITPAGLSVLKISAQTPRALNKAGYPTPKTGTGGPNHNAPQVLAGNHGMNLEGMAHVVMMGLLTPSATDHKGGKIRNGKLSADRLDLASQLMTAGWATPNTMDLLPPRSKEAMQRQFAVARKGRTAPANLREQVHPELYPQNGQTSNGFIVETESTDQSSQDLNQSCQLNPRLSAWLMGYPEEWCKAAITAHRLIQAKPKRPA